MNEPARRCQSCQRMTHTTNNTVRILQVCWDTEREQWLCFRCYKSPPRTAGTAADRQGAI